MGIVITERHQQFAFLEDAQYDEEGALGQRQNELDRGNRHYTGTLVIENEFLHVNNPYRIDCRVVLGSPRTIEQSPPVITILRKRSNRGDMTVTAHIERMLKRGQITAKDLINYFHPAYARGEIESSNDCEDIFRKYVISVQINSRAVDAAGKEIIKNPEPILKTIVENEIEGIELRAPSNFKKLPIPNVKYDYIILDSYIENVKIEDDMIKFDFIDSQGELRKMHSFKLSSRKYLSSLHQYAFEYLISRQKQRALFAVCDSGPCSGFFAESVTAISLQIMRSDVAKKMTANLKKNRSGV